MGNNNWMWKLSYLTIGSQLVLQDTVERLLVDNEFCDLHRGIYLIRGENVALMGDVDPKMEEVISNQECRYLTKMPENYMQKLALQRENKANDDQDKKAKMLRDKGLSLFREMPGDQYVWKKSVASYFKQKFRKKSKLGKN